MSESKPHQRDLDLSHLVEQMHRQREARKPKLLPEQGSSRIRFAPPSHCPFDHALLTRRFFFEGIPLTDDETSRCIAAARRRPSEVLDAVTVPCESVSLADGIVPAYRIRGHSHANLLIDGHRVHVEAIYQELAGPGGINREIRLYVDGLLHGRGHALGRLGGNVIDLPAVAQIGDDLFISAEPVHYDAMSELIVELRTHRRR